jgi:hypothetical protein
MHYGSMKHTRHRGKREDQVGGGNKRREPHPNGGEVSRVDIPRAKMPQNSQSAPIHHKPLNTGNDATGLGKMPRQVLGPRQRDPFRR